MKNNEPLFITGSWRSGTTLISRVFNNHQNMQVTYDTVHFMRFIYNQYKNINLNSSKEKLIDDLNKRLKKRFNYKINKNKFLLNNQRSFTYEILYNSIMNEFLKINSEDKNWGEKTNLAWRQIPDFFKMFPNGRVIHLVRDPRAILSSWKKFTNAKKSDYLDSISNSFDSMKYSIKYLKKYNKKKYSLIAYEELVSDPVLTIKKICKKLEINYDPNMLNSSKYTDNRGKKWLSNSSYKSKTNKITSRNINKWKKNLNDWEILLTDISCSQFYKNFNYIKSSIVYSKIIKNEILKNLKYSELSTEGILNILLFNEGFQRYPNDPTNSKNWGKN